MHQNRDETRRGGDRPASPRKDDEFVACCFIFFWSAMTGQPLGLPTPPPNDSKRQLPIGAPVPKTGNLGCSEALPEVANHCSVMCGRLFLRVQSLRLHLFSQNFRYLPAGRQLVAAVQKLGRLGNLSACPCSEKQFRQNISRRQLPSITGFSFGGFHPTTAVVRCSVQFLSVKQTVSAEVSVEYID